MVAIVMGSGLGLVGTSSSVLGAAGQLGAAGLGQGGEAVTVNARTGNLIVQHQDELLIGRGPDVSVIRTYNSNATFDFDNNDDWQLSLYKKLSNLTGTVNTAGSTLCLTGGDGAELTYTYDAGLGQYTNKDVGGGLRQPELCQCHQHLDGHRWRQPAQRNLRGEPDGGRMAHHQAK